VTVVALADAKIRMIEFQKDDKLVSKLCEIVSQPESIGLARARIVKDYE
jgi:hypothetical protein